MAGSGRQRTFDLVPETLVPQNAPKKPMTLKQAKKAAAIASRQPKMSRAERARMEKEELDRQRKESERQRAAEKAKAVRDKKAAKLAEEKAERKRMGIPEPSRFVRGSQPAISAFVTMDSKRRKTEVEGISESVANVSRNYGISEQQTSNISAKNYQQLDEEEVPSPAAEIPNGLPPILSSPREFPSEQQSDHGNHDKLPNPTTKHLPTSPRALPLVQFPSSQPRPETSNSPIRTTTKNNLKIMCQEAMDEFDEFDDDTELFAAMAESIETGSKPPGDTTRDRAGQKQVRGLRKAPSYSNSPVNMRAVQTAMLPPPLPRKQIAMARQETVTIENKAPLTTSVLTPARGDNTANPSGFAKPAGSLCAKPMHRTSQFNNLGARPLGDSSASMPPPALSFKRPYLRNSSFATSPPTKQISSTNFMPSSTQAFLNDNLESFFPSPTQELRELEDDDPLDNLEDFFPTPTQEMRELNEEDEAARHKQVKPFKISVVRGEPSNFGGSQKPKLIKPSIVEKPSGNFSNAVQKKQKSRFFMEKEEDLMRATEEAIARGDFDSSAQNPNLKRKFSRVASGSSDYDEDDMDWNSQEAMLALEIGEEVI